MEKENWKKKKIRGENQREKKSLGKESEGKSRAKPEGNQIEIEGKSVVKKSKGNQWEKNRWEKNLT